MSCRGCWECLLKILNFLFTLAGLAMVGYGIYLFVEYKNASPGTIPAPMGDKLDLVQFGRPMLTAVSLSDSFLDKLPTAWFIYLFIAIGVILFVVSCFGCIGTATRNGCCLSCYAVLLVILILVELGCAAFIFFDKRWKDEIPADKTGTFDMIFAFLKENWAIIRWVALGIVILEALVFLLALVVRSANAPADYDSDDEYSGSRQQIQQSLLERQAVPASNVPVAGPFTRRQIRNDAWSARMREKYGLDTNEFTYNPSEANRLQPAEEKSRCAIM